MDSWTSKPDEKKVKTEEELDDESMKELLALKDKACREMEEKLDDQKHVTKKAKDEVSPKKRTGYAYFCTFNREGVKSKNPDMKAKDVTRELARLWKDLSKEEQKEWSASASEL